MFGPGQSLAMGAPQPAAVAKPPGYYSDRLEQLRAKRAVTTPPLQPAVVDIPDRTVELQENKRAVQDFLNQGNRSFFRKALDTAMYLPRKVGELWQEKWNLPVVIPWAAAIVTTLSPNSELAAIYRSKGRTGAQAYRESWEEWSLNKWYKAGLETIADPTNLIGWGLLGKIPAVGRLLGPAEKMYLKAVTFPFSAGAKGYRAVSKAVETKLPTTLFTVPHAGVTVRMKMMETRQLIETVGMMSTSKRVAVSEMNTVAPVLQAANQAKTLEAEALNNIILDSLFDAPSVTLQLGARLGSPMLDIAQVTEMAATTTRIQAMTEAERMFRSGRAVASRGEIWGGKATASVQQGILIAPVHDAAVPIYKRMIMATDAESVDKAAGEVLSLLGLTPTPELMGNASRMMRQMRETYTSYMTNMSAKSGKELLDNLTGSALSAAKDRAVIEVNRYRTQQGGIWGVVQKAIATNEASIYPVWKKYIEDIAIAPLAEAGLAFTGYTLGNLPEEFMRSIFGGSKPGFMPAKTYARLMIGQKIPAGYGDIATVGADISQRGRWSLPGNLGPAINLPGYERVPGVIKSIMEKSGLVAKVEGKVGQAPTYKFLIGAPWGASKQPITQSNINSQLVRAHAHNNLLMGKIADGLGEGLDKTELIRLVFDRPQALLALPKDMQDNLMFSRLATLGEGAGGNKALINSITKKVIDEGQMYKVIAQHPNAPPLAKAYAMAHAAEVMAGAEKGFYDGIRQAAFLDHWNIPRNIMLHLEENKKMWMKMLEGADKEGVMQAATYFNYIKDSMAAASGKIQDGAFKGAASLNPTLRRQALDSMDSEIVTLWAHPTEGINHQLDSMMTALQARAKAVGVELDNVAQGFAGWREAYTRIQPELKSLSERIRSLPARERDWETYYATRAQIWDEARNAASRSSAQVQFGLEQAATGSLGAKVPPTIQLPAGPWGPAHVAKILGVDPRQFEKIVEQNSIFWSEDGFKNYFTKMLRLKKYNVTEVVEKKLGRVWKQMSEEVPSLGVSEAMRDAEQMAQKILKIPSQPLVNEAGLKEIHDWVQATGKAAGTKSGKVTVSKLKALIEKSNEQAIKEVDEAFLNFTDPTAIDMFMRSFVPFWMYSSRIPFWVAKEGMKHPGLIGVWARDQENTDRGYVSVTSSLQWNVFKGTGINRFNSKWMMRDYPEYFQNIFMEAIDLAGRFGIYSPVIETALSAYFSTTTTSPTGEKLPIEAGGILPPAAMTIADIATALVPSKSLDRIRNFLFHDRYRDYQVDMAFRTAHGNEVGELRDAERMISDISTPIERKKELQRWIDEAKREIALLSLATSPLAQFRYRPELFQQYQALNDQALTEITGISSEDRRTLSLMGYRTTDVIGGMSPEQRRLLRQIEGNYYSGITVRLMPIEWQQVLEQQDAFYDEARTLQHDRFTSQLALDLAFAEGRIPSKNWRDTSSSYMSTYVDNKNGIQASYENRGVPLTNEAKLEWKERTGQPTPTTDPVTVLTDKYWEATPKEVPGMPGEYDWDAFFKGREDVENSVPPDLQDEFYMEITRTMTPMEKMEWQVNRDILNSYWDIREKVISRLPARYQATVHRALMGFADARNTIAYKVYSSQVSQQRAALRDRDQVLDYWLYYFGYTTVLRSGARLFRLWGMSPPNLQPSTTWPTGMEEVETRGAQVTAQKLGLSPELLKQT